MPSRRNTPSAGGAQRQPDATQLRWRSVAGSGSPRGGDITSSPDPLNDGASPERSVLSSNARRMTRSHRVHKFLSLGATPRRLAFELDVNNSGGRAPRGRAPRGGLIVSVEENKKDADTASPNTTTTTTTTNAARLRKGAAATTTTVPLKYSVEDESSDVLGSTNATPRSRPRKTRIRASNGTPIPKPTTGKRRRDSSPPARETPGRPGTVEDSMESDSIDDLTMRSPTPKRRNTRSPRQRVAEPSSELGAETIPRVTPAKRSVRRRRYPMAPPQLAGRTDAGISPTEMSHVPTSEDDLQRDMTATVTVDMSREMSAPATDAEPESDIWIAAASRDTTPRASVEPAERATAQVEEREEEEEEEEREPSVAMSQEDYGFLPPAASDASSDDEPAAEPTATRRNDTIAQGEDFSMILMDSIHSLRESTQGAPPPLRYSPLGDDTNLIINETLESLRQGDVADREDEGEDEEDDDADTLSGRDYSGNDAAVDETAAPELPAVAAADFASGPELEAQPDESSQPEAAETDAHEEEPEMLDSRESENEAAAEEATAAAATPEPVVVDVESAFGLEGQPDASKPEAVSEPVAEPASEPVAEPLSEPVTEPVAAPVASTASEPVASAASEPVVESASEPAAELASEAAEDDEEDLYSALDKIVEQRVSHFRREVEQEVTAELEPTFTAAFSVESEPEVAAASSSKSPGRRSPPTARSARLSSSPRKATSSPPLRFRVFKRYGGQSEGSPPKSTRRSATPDRPARPASGLSPVQESAEDSFMYEDSFSEIPEEVLARAVPRANEYEELNDEQMDEVMGELEARQEQYAASEQFAPLAHEPEELELELEHERDQEMQADDYQLPYLSPGNDEEEELGDDSVMEETGDADSDDEQVADEAGQEAAGEQPALSSDVSEAQSEPNRLLTPDDSPQSAPVLEAPTTASRPSSWHPLLHGSPIQLRDDTPKQSPEPSAGVQPALATRQAEVAAQGSASPLEETPRNQLSSPTQQPQSVAQESASASQMRPALSSIVRAGRALQSVTSDPPSPEARERHLGSPFRSSGSKERRSGSRELESGRLPSRSPGGRISKSPSGRASKSPMARRLLSFGRLDQSSLSPEGRSPLRDSTRDVTSPARSSSLPPPSAEAASVSPPRASLFSKSTSRTDLPAAEWNPAQPDPQSGSVSPSSSPPREPLFSKSIKAAEALVATLESPQPSVSPRRESSLRLGATSIEPLSPMRRALRAEALRTRGSIMGRVSATSSLRQSPDSDTQSWIENAGPISPSLRGDNTLQEVAAASAQPARRKFLFERSPVLPALEPRVPEPEQAPEPEPEVEAEAEPELPTLPADDEADIWELEAQRDVLARRRNASFGKSMRHRPRPREFLKPLRPRQEPWMRPVATRPVASTYLPPPRPFSRAGLTQLAQLRAKERAAAARRDEQALVEERGESSRRNEQAPVEERGEPSRRNEQAPVEERGESSRQNEQLPVEERGESSRHDEQPRQEEDTEEYSLLARTRAAEEAENLSESAAKASRFDLSTFFSSPIAIGGMLAKKFFPGLGKPAATGPRYAKVTPLISKRKKSPTSVGSGPGSRLFSFFGFAAAPEPLEPSEPLEQPRAPRLGMTTTTLGSGQGLFGRTSSHDLVVGSRAQSVEKVVMWQRQNGLPWLMSSPNGAEDLPRLSPLKPSGPKSCFRSPSKPKTQGRVVEFTSSVLSPPAQALAREQRREREYQEALERGEIPEPMDFGSDDDNGTEPPLLYGGGLPPPPPPPPPQPEPQPQPQPREKRWSYGYDIDESVSSDDVSMTDAPPLEEAQQELPGLQQQLALQQQQAALQRQQVELQQQQVEGQGDGRHQAPQQSDQQLGPLSQSSWSRQHWLVLEGLMQVRLQGPYHGSYEHLAERLFGKTVRGRGTDMVIEAWHMECIEAFQAIAGGWDGRELAKRLFSLIKAAEMRKPTLEEEEE